MELEIRANTAVCAICGAAAHTSPDIPIIIAQRGTGKPVCLDCAEEHAPDVFAAYMEACRFIYPTDK